MKRVGVTGGRDYADAETVERALTRLPEDAVLVHGDAPGADSLAADWWSGKGRVVEPHPADWQGRGKAAGPLRNQEMVDSGLDMLIAFPGGRGTADMTLRAQDAGIPVLHEGRAAA